MGNIHTPHMHACEHTHTLGKKEGKVSILKQTCDSWPEQAQPHKYNEKTKEVGKERKTTVLIWFSQ